MEQDLSISSVNVVEPTIPVLTDVVLVTSTNNEPSIGVVVNSYEQAQAALDTVVQSVNLARQRWLDAVQAAIEQADAVRILAENRALESSELARSLAEQAKTAALDSTRYSQEARAAADTVRQHQGLLTSVGGGGTGAGV